MLTRSQTARNNDVGPKVPALDHESQEELTVNEHPVKRSTSPTLFADCESTCESSCESFDSSTSAAPLTAVQQDDDDMEPYSLHAINQEALDQLSLAPRMSSSNQLVEMVRASYSKDSGVPSPLRETAEELLSPVDLVKNKALYFSRSSKNSANPGGLQPRRCEVGDPFAGYEPPQSGETEAKGVTVDMVRKLSRFLSLPGSTPPTGRNHDDDGDLTNPILFEATPPTGLCAPKVGPAFLSTPSSAQRYFDDADCISVAGNAPKQPHHNATSHQQQSKTAQRSSLQKNDGVFSTKSVTFLQDTPMPNADDNEVVMSSTPKKAKTAATPQSVGSTAPFSPVLTPSNHEALLQSSPVLAPPMLSKSMSLGGAAMPQHPQVTCSPVKKPTIREVDVQSFMRQLSCGSSSPKKRNSPSSPALEPRPSTPFKSLTDSMGADLVNVAPPSFVFGSPKPMSCFLTPTPVKAPQPTAAPLLAPLLGVALLEEDDDDDGDSPMPPGICRESSLGSCDFPEMFPEMVGSDIFLQPPTLLRRSSSQASQQVKRHNKLENEILGDTDLWCLLNDLAE